MKNSYLWLLLFIASINCNEVDDHDCKARTSNCNNNYFEDEQCIVHKAWHSFEAQYILQYIVLFPFIGVSAILGLGADVTKVSISMQLLEYLNYDSTILTYFASFSASLSYVIYLIITKQSKLIDLDMILLLYAYIIIWTDVGNYFNQEISDGEVVLITCLIEILFLLIMSNRYLRQRKSDAKLYNQNVICQEVLEGVQEITKILSSQDVASYQDPYVLQSETTRRKSISHKTLNSIFRCQLISILSSQFILQLIFLMRGGDRFNFFSEQVVYGAAIYWILTASVYILSLVMIILNYCYLMKKEQQMKREFDPEYTLTRSYNFKNFLIMFFVGSAGCVLTGLIGTGAGILILPCLIWRKKEFKLSPQQVTATMALGQVLIHFSTIEQSILSFKPFTNIEDVLLYSLIGFFSAIFGIIFKQFYFKGEFHQSRIIKVIILLYSFDMGFGIFKLGSNRIRFDELTTPKCKDYN